MKNSRWYLLPLLRSPPSLFLWLSKTKKPNIFSPTHSLYNHIYPINMPHHLHHELTDTKHVRTPICVALFQTHTPSMESDQHPVQIVLTHLESCTNLSELNQIHAQMIRNHMLQASFHWNSIMRSYLRLTHPQMALRLFTEMLRAGLSPDSYTLPIALKAASHVFALDLGWQLHSVAIKHGLECNEFCESGIISFYAKAGKFDCAHKVFEKNTERNLGSWNAIISGLAQGGHSEEAVGLFIELRKCGLIPDDVTMVSVASACGSLGDLNLAQQVHKYVLQAQFSGESDLILSNSLVDMYGKCGRTDLAYRVFSRMSVRNVSSWTTMIMGLATDGHVSYALDFFRQMRQGGVRPNHVTFVGVLSACVHSGLVDDGMRYFDSMVGEHGIEPTMAHYGCMVDMLGRVGRLEEARAMVERMPMKANSVIWGTLMGACEKHGNVEIGEWVAGKLIEMEPWNDGVYVVLSNIYAGAALWGKVERVRSLMRERRVAKTPGYSLATISI